MNQLPYPRDIWVLSTQASSVNCRGRFPRGFIPEIERRKWLRGKVLIPCCGDFRRPGAVHLDLRSCVHPDIIGDAGQLPFEDETFDTVLLDPPYSEQEARDLYDLPYINIIKALNESCRVLKPGGGLLFLHRLYPQRHPSLGMHWKRMQTVALIGIVPNAGFGNIRLLSVWRKNGGLSGMFAPEKPQLELEVRP